jgi:TonB family protein
VGCDADVPKKVMEVASDLSGLDVTGLNALEMVEILIDVQGEVQQACLRSGVREDVDDRAVAAVQRWRFEPARLRQSTSPGVAVPIVMTVTLRIGASQ